MAPRMEGCHAAGDAEKTTVKTAYGPANLSKFNTRDRAPKITTQNKHYNRAHRGRYLHGDLGRVDR